MSLQKKQQKRKVNFRSSAFIKKDQIQQKIYQDNVKFMAGMFLSYDKK